MAEEYEAFVRDRDHAVSGNQVVLTLRDLTPGRHKYKGINVRAVISEAPVAGEPLLWLQRGWCSNSRAMMYLNFFDFFGMLRLPRSARALRHSHSVWLWYTPKYREMLT